MAAKTVPTVTTRAIKNSTTGIDMHILDSVVTGTNNTILYQIVVVTNLAEHKDHQFGVDDVIHFVVKHDYNEFESFHTKLSERYPASILPPLPGKVFITNYNTIKKRKTMLNAIIEFIASSSKLSNCELVQDFLQARQKPTSKPKNQAVDATDNHPLSQNFAADDTEKIEVKNNSDDDGEDLFGSNTKANTRSDDNIFDKIEQDAITNFGNYNTEKDTGNLFMPTSEQSEQIQEKPEETSDAIDLHNDDLDELMKQINDDDSNKPKPTPKPKPKPKPKFTAVNQGNKDQTSSITDNVHKMDITDLSKYIQDNSADDDVSLF